MAIGKQQVLGMMITETDLSAYRRAHGQDNLDYRHLPRNVFTWTERYFGNLQGSFRSDVSGRDLIGVVIVFAFLKKVPPLPSGRTWISLHQQAGSHANEQYYFVAPEITVHPELHRALRQVARDRWPGGRAGWDGRHFCSAELGCNKAEVDAYRAEIAGLGLRYSGDWLTESIYPVDATQTNLDVLSGGTLSLAELGVDSDAKVKRTGASFLILSPNSD